MDDCKQMIILNKDYLKKAQIQISMRSLSGLDFHSQAGCHSKVIELRLPNYLLITGGEKVLIYTFF